MPKVYNFKADIAKIAAAIDADVATVQKKLTIEAFKLITLLTPVDTGRARASWALGVGAPSNFLPAEVPKGGAVLPSPDMDFSELAKIDGKQPSYITSNLVYMNALEHGHSQQAPAGMVRITIAALEIAMKKFTSGK